MTSVILSESPRVEFIHGDCLKLLKSFKDNSFDLAIVDPPYGIGKWNHTGGNSISEVEAQKINGWDESAPGWDYFSHLKIKAKESIIWGGNYFLEHLGNCRAPIIWDKKMRGMHFADGEMAWTSFKKNTLRIADVGIVSTRATRGKRIHPTQKPIELYDWILKNYAKEGDRILDTHLGSGSSAIAAFRAGLEFVGIEIDKDYFKAAVNRFEKQSHQLRML